MINQIVLTSNTALEYSRAQLLCWLNELLASNLNKIQQLGTGAAYCQLFHHLYPHKISLQKVNFKAKHDYEFVNNFKLLQQSFIKMGLNKNIEIEKLIRCKYQDNLQLLQWFKKIFESSGNGSGVRENVVELQRRREREQKLQGCSEEGFQYQYSILPLHMSNRIHDLQHFRQNSHLTIDPPDSPQNIPSDQLWRDSIKERTLEEETTFYEVKMQEIEGVLREWDCSKESSQLIIRMRDILFKVPTLQSYNIQQPQQSS